MTKTTKLKPSPSALQRMCCFSSSESAVDCSCLNQVETVNFDSILPANLSAGISNATDFPSKLNIPLLSLTVRLSCIEGRRLMVSGLMSEKWVFLSMVHHHHHHHVFLNCPFLPRSIRVRRFSRYEVSPHIPEHYPFRVQTQLLHIIPHTFSPSLPAPTRTSHPSHHHISTGRHPIIFTLTLHMPKPPQSTTPHHLSHTLNPQKTVQIHTALSILQRHPTHPSHRSVHSSVSISQFCEIWTSKWEVEKPSRWILYMSQKVGCLSY